MTKFNQRNASIKLTGHHASFPTRWLERPPSGWGPPVVDETNFLPSVPLLHIFQLRNICLRLSNQQQQACVCIFIHFRIYSLSTLAYTKVVSNSHNSTEALWFLELKSQLLELKSQFIFFVYSPEMNDYFNTIILKLSFEKYKQFVLRALLCFLFS